MQQPYYPSHIDTHIQVQLLGQNSWEGPSEFVVTDKSAQGRTYKDRSHRELKPNIFDLHVVQTSLLPLHSEQMTSSAACVVHIARLSGVI